MDRFKWKENGFKILDGEIQIQYSTSFRRFILDNNIFKYECNKCGINTWNNEKITLEVEHKDGNNWNNEKHNLELLCPNCHSQTLTFRKRKNNSNEYLVTNNDILEQLKIQPNINQVLLALSLDNSGGNYRRIHKIIKHNQLENFYELPKHKEKSINNKISNIELFNNRLNIIKNSNIDFTIKGWGVKLSKCFNITPQASIIWVKNKLPMFYEECFKHNI